MHTLVLHLPPEPERPPLTELLRDWLLRSELGDSVLEFGEDADHEGAEVVISEGDRRLQLRLRHAEGELWRLDAATWLVHAGHRGPWTSWVGVVIFGGGLAISFGYLGWSALTFWLGVLTSVIMALLLTWVVRRQVARGRLTPIETGPHAEALMQRIVPAIRGDRRVREVQPVEP